MAAYVVIAPLDIPALGENVQGMIYRGDHPDEASAVAAAAAALRLPTGRRCWAFLQTAATRYTVTQTSSYTSVVG